MNKYDNINLFSRQYEIDFFYLYATPKYFFMIHDDTPRSFSCMALMVSSIR